MNNEAGTQVSLPAVTMKLPSGPGDIANGGRVRPHSAPRIGAAHVNLVGVHGWGPGAWQGISHKEAYNRCPRLTLEEMPGDDKPRASG